MEDEKARINTEAHNIRRVQTIKIKVAKQKTEQEREGKKRS